MLNLSLRSRVNGLFKARSTNRDAEADYSRTDLVYRAIEEALTITEAEHFGLTARVQRTASVGTTFAANRRLQVLESCTNESVS